MRRGLGVLIAILALALAAPAGTAFAASAGGDGSAQAAAKKKGKKKGKKKKKKKVGAKVKRTVCKKGCKFRTIQKAVKASNRNDVIKVKPGKYVEGVTVRGHKYDGLRIVGTGKSPKAVILEGKNAKTKDGLAQNGVDAENVNRIKIENLTVRNYAANGILVHGETEICRDYLLKKIVAAYNRAYGLFAFDCIGGRMTQSEAYGHGDSGFYVGQTRPQTQPVTTTLDNLKAHTNVLGYSGTNSKYQVIRDSDFYNNGVGLVPNTLDSEKFEPAADSVIRNNNIFWNNFNYYLPNSPVKTISNGLGEPVPGLTVQFPIGVGVVLLGSDGWTVENNNIFGNFMWGVSILSDPFNEGGDAISRNNRVINNTMGRGGTDTNQYDFFNDAGGPANCFQGNSSSTFHDVGPTDNSASLYPPCPASGVPEGGGEQFGFLLDFVTSTDSDPPQNQECYWAPHPHPAFEGYTPLRITPGPACP